MTGDVFGLVGVAPLPGRTFLSEDADAREMVLPHGVWTTRFGADPTAPAQWQGKVAEAIVDPPNRPLPHPEHPK